MEIPEIPGNHPLVVIFLQFSPFWVTTRDPLTPALPLQWWMNHVRAEVSLMGSLELFHLYHHFIILDDVAASSDEISILIENVEREERQGIYAKLNKSNKVDLDVWICLIVLLWFHWCFVREIGADQQEKDLHINIGPSEVGHVDDFGVPRAREETSYWTTWDSGPMHGTSLEY